MQQALVRRRVFTFDQGIKYFFRFNAAIAILVILALVVFLFQQGMPFFKHHSPLELLGRNWATYRGEYSEYGLIPLFVASAWVVVLAMGMAVPMGVCAAVYIAEIAGEREKSFLKNFIEVLASFPSVVMGFFALAALAPFVQDFFHLTTGRTLLTASIVLAMMALPTVISVSEDAIRNVPLEYKRASLALGASRLTTLMRVILPAASKGIIAAFMLGIGRVVGETMAVLMVAGMSRQIPLSPIDSGRPMTATIAAEMGEVSAGSDGYSVLFLIGIVLFFITLGINLAILRLTSGKAAK